MAWLHRGPDSRYRTASVEEVERANAMQILTSEAEIYARPGTAFEAFAERVHKHQCYPYPGTTV
ncbi:hypothetical protein ABH941_008138 [Streptacidiphilus sp. EB103A]